MSRPILEKPLSRTAVFKEKILASLDEEEVDLYVLTMYYQDHEDLNFFGAADQKRVKEIFGVLIQNTKKHRDILERILDFEKECC